MADEYKTRDELLTDFANNVTKNITPQFMRNFVVSTFLGWGAYDDQASKLLAISGLAGTPEPITIDKLGSNTNENYLPHNITQLWDTTTNRIDLAGIPVGSFGVFRMDITMTPASVQSESFMWIDAYTGAGAPAGSSKFTFPSIKAASNPTPEWVVIPFYVDPFIVNGGFGFRLEVDKDFSLEIGSILIATLISGG